MHQLHLIIFVIYFLTTSCCTRFVPSVELSFYDDVIKEHPQTGGLICPSDDEMVGSCKKLFLRPHYRYEIKVHLNNMAYQEFPRTGKNLCEENLITFRAKPEKFPKDRVERMFPCFGRHSTIRTSYDVDDYYRRYYLSYFPKTKTYYVFVGERHGTPKVWYTFYEEIRHNSWQRFASTVSDQIDGSKLLPEKVLHTIEMFNYWPREIENIFVNEMIHDRKSKPNQLANQKKPDLMMALCTSILRNSLIPDDTFIVDLKKMQDWDPEPRQIRVYFDYEKHFNDSPHEGYPCYGKHSSNVTSLNVKYSDMFLLSSGPQENTLFLFSYLANENHYMITSFIANVNFRNFYPVENILAKYVPNLSGPSQPPTSTEPAMPPMPFAPQGLSRPVGPSTSQIHSMPSTSQHYQLPNPSTQHQPSTFPSQQFTFPVLQSDPGPPNISMPPGSSTAHPFPAQAAPAAPFQSSGPSTSHRPPAPSRHSGSEPSENF